MMPPVSRRRRNLLSDESVEALISLVQEEPIIWDPRHTEYKNPSATELAWHKVANVLNLEDWNGELHAIDCVVCMY